MIITSIITSLILLALAIHLYLFNVKLQKRIKKSKTLVNEAILEMRRSKSKLEQQQQKKVLETVDLYFKDNAFDYLENLLPSLDLKFCFRALKNECSLFIEIFPISEYKRVNVWVSYENGIYTFTASKKLNLCSNEINYRNIYTHEIARHLLNPVSLAEVLTEIKLKLDNLKTETNDR